MALQLDLITFILLASRIAEEVNGRFGNVDLECSMVGGPNDCTHGEYRSQ